MTTLEALLHFASVVDRSPYEIHADMSELGSVVPGGDGNVWVEAMTSAVRLSGNLPYCHTEDDLIQAVEQFDRFFRVGLVKMEEWESDLLEVIIEQFVSSQHDDHLAASHR